MMTDAIKVEAGFRLFSWNTAGRAIRLEGQLQALIQKKPEVIALQEVTLRTLQGLRLGLEKAGYWVVNSFDLAKDLQLLKGPRRYGELIACKWQLTPLSPLGFQIPWPERMLSAILESPWGQIELHSTHIPPGVSNHWIKIETLEGICTHLMHPAIRPRVLCGDFNTPQAERPDGEVITWGQQIGLDSSLSIRKGKRQDKEDFLRWDRGERNVLTGLAEFDLPDVFRMLHGYDVQEFSWYWHGKWRQIGRRYDHIFSSRSLHAVRCGYLHDWRQKGLSDHAPIDAYFEPR
jgi:exonuclease III